MFFNINRGFGNTVDQFSVGRLRKLPVASHQSSRLNLRFLRCRPHSKMPHRPEPLYNDPYWEVHNWLEAPANGDDTLLPQPILSPWLSPPLGFEYGQHHNDDELFDTLAFGNDLASPGQVEEMLICKRREVTPAHAHNSQSSVAPGTSLRRRKRIEGGYTCDAAGCSRSFSRNCDLTKHSQRAHLNEADRPLGCELCDRRFSDRQGLNRHIASHYKRDQRRLPPQQSHNTAEVSPENDLGRQQSSPVSTSRASPEARSILMWKLARLHVIGLLSRVAQEVCQLAERNYIWFEHTYSGLVPRLKMDINPFDVVLEREWRNCELANPCPEASDGAAQSPLAIIFSLLDPDQNWQVGSILEKNRLGYTKVTTALTTQDHELSDADVRVDSMRAFVSFLCWGLDVAEPEWNDRQVCCLKERLECSMDD